MKTIGYRTAQTARAKYEAYFASYEGTRFFEVTQDDFDEDDNWGPGGYIEAPDAIADAFDSAIKKIRLLGKNWSTEKKNATVKELMDQAA